MLVRCLLVVAGLLVTPALALADGHAPLDLPVWSMAPFVLLLLVIAVLPLAAPHWWHSNVNKAIVSLVFAVPVVAYLTYLQAVEGQPAMDVLGHQLLEYVVFIGLLTVLFVVSGGIVLTGDLRATPLVNTTFLAVGALLASVIGTTGASMLLIRPVLRTNRERKVVGHIPVFFVFVVSNLGGLLTPLGDPPLFLGYLKGVPFAWTLGLWLEWLVANGAVLVVFFLWDSVAYASEPDRALRSDARHVEPLRLRGGFNFVLLGGVILAVLTPSWVPGVAGKLLGVLVMVALAGASWRFTPTADRRANGFTWGPIIEVAVLFAGIFVAMVPALERLQARGAELGLTEPWQFFWLTGALSAFLDNAPTYLAFASVAAGHHDLGWLAANNPAVLAAISCGAVFFGAMTYIGNGPNFMVKAIADEAGYKTPSFFGYLAYSCLVLLPIFAVISLVFFPAG